MSATFTVYLITVVFICVALSLSDEDARSGMLSNVISQGCYYAL